jgi:CBS domain containing-hemolysin-like protein
MSDPAVIQSGFEASDIVIVVVILVLLVASTILALAETGLVRMTKAKAMTLVEERRHGSRHLLHLVEHPEEFLNPILFLVLVCQLVAATLVGVIATHVFGALGVAMATAFEVVVIFVLVEAAPKTWAVQNVERAALLAAPIVYVIIRFPPVQLVSRFLMGLVMLLLPSSARAAGSDITEEELLAFADVALQEDVIETEERALIHSIIAFGDTIVREVMVPRPDMVSVDGAHTVESALEMAMEAGRSRLPVYMENLDDVVGVAYMKDLMRAHHEGRSADRVALVARKAQFVPETKRVAPLMREMQAQKFHLAVVVDEYGGTAGLVTLEDLIEELVGEIVDEFDVEAPLVDDLGNGELSVSARLVISEANERTGADLPSGAWDTVGGLVFSLLGHVPAEGESVAVDGHVLVAEKVNDRRIERVRIVPLRTQPRSAGPRGDRGVGHVGGGGAGSETEK